METTLPRDAVSWGKLVDDLRVIINDAESLLKGLAGDMGEQAKAARSSLVKQLESAKVTYGELQDKALAQARVADRTVRSHPYETMGVALGVGILVGVLVTRDRD
jgi:ElaB/YqjD/DUF883 family membrane-anchored ribosome-binding protein